jgi:hypothetical protein
MNFSGFFVKRLQDIPIYSPKATPAEMSDTLKAVIVDDEEFARENLRMLLED